MLLLVEILVYIKEPNIVLTFGLMFGCFEIIFCKYFSNENLTSNSW